MKKMLVLGPKREVFVAYRVMRMESHPDITQPAGEGPLW
jgi:hypothetical protein